MRTLVRQPTRLLVPALVAAGAVALAFLAAGGDHFSAWLLPLLAVPIVAVYRAGRIAARIEREVLHDALTGLPGRWLFERRLAEAIAEESSPAVVLLDLDRFKEVNDAVGHRQGDELLRRVAGRLASGLPAVETLARLGSDEFGLLVRSGGAERAARVAAQVIAALERPFTLEGLEVEARASAGIAAHPDHGGDPETLMRRAEAAMYAAKQTGEGCAVYRPGLDERDPAQLELVSQLRRAIERRELTLVYQPKVEPRSGAVHAVEALVRWRHPRRGLIPPGEFVPLAEQTGLIGPLTSFVLEEALAQCREWTRRGLDLGVAVNLPARILLDAGLADEVAARLRESGLEPRRLTLEVTESMIMREPVRAASVLGRLGAMGVALSIDDFGTGHSSLAQLKRLPVSELKIDRSFVCGMDTDREDAAIVRWTVDLGHDLGLRVVAEGVESDAVRRELAEIGADLVQGFALGRPVAGEELARWVSGRRFARGRAGAGAAWPG